MAANPPLSEQQREDAALCNYCGKRKTGLFRRTGNAGSTRICSQCWTLRQPFRRAAVKRARRLRSPSND